jgi:hypothetical protein
MMQTRLSFLIILLGSCFCASGNIEIPLEIADGGYLFVKVVVNEKETAKFMLDTGAGINVVSTDLFNRIKHSLISKGMHTGVRHNGESITGRLYELPSLAVGEYRKSNVVIGEFAALTNFDGLLSMDFFRDTPFTIDFVNRKLIIEDTESFSKIKQQSEQIPIEVRRRGKYEIDLFAKVCINDSLEAVAEFDTGAGFAMFMLNTSYLKKLHIVVPPKKSVDMNYYVHSSTISRLSFCGLPSLFARDHFVGFKEGLIYESLIGSGLFRNCKLTIDIPTGQMIVRR